ncbi:diguanylate cyclase [Shewanella aestuarii]|uniref:diguanylate cyclase n=1 Tax=Shewanella aestuarii TaxID=1028752 RepID=A0A6G9QNK2_9GAMM|nr:diguanylate cyclase [Shewanella aestuarii]QIR15988.1 diguanylate cyclase [Shewanella aestuarii]
MTLRSFSLALLSSLLLSLMLLLMLIYYIVYLPNIESEIIDQQQQEYQLLQSAFALSKQGVSSLSFDYAVWDEMVSYVQNPNNEFIHENMVSSSFEATNIHAVFIHNVDRQLVWKYQNEVLKGVKATIRQGDVDLAILPSQADIALQKVSERSGYIVVAGQLVFYSNHTIVPSSGVGEVAGSLTMVRLVTEKLVDELSRFSLVNFSLLPVDPNSMATFEEFFTAKPISVMAKSHTWVLVDPFDQQQLLLTIYHKKFAANQLPLTTVLLIFLFLGLIVALGMQVLSLLLTEPINQFNESIKSLPENNYINKVPSEYFIKELVSVSHSFNQLLNKFNAQQNYLETLTVQDALTGIANRRGLEAFGNKTISNWQDLAVGFSVIMIDVDHFKHFNDTQGHLAGDEALKTVAKNLQQTATEFQDDRVFVARYGGEEFCVIALFDDPLLVGKMAESLRAKVESNKIANTLPDKQWLTISAGGVIISAQTSDKAYRFNDFLKLADEQLYLAKKAGRNQVKLVEFNKKPTDMTP